MEMLHVYSIFFCENELLLQWALIPFLLKGDGIDNEAILLLIDLIIFNCCTLILCFAHLKQYYIK